MWFSKDDQRKDKPIIIPAEKISKKSDNMYIQLSITQKRNQDVANFSRKANRIKSNQNRKKEQQTFKSPELHSQSKLHKGDFLFIYYQAFIFEVRY